MKVLGIVCSPRSKGNTEILMNKLLQTARKNGADAAITNTRNKEIAPCDGCGTCKETGECKIEDDMQEIYKKMLESDAIIFGSPVYFWNVSAQAKTVIDRTYALSWKRKLRGKKGGVIIIAARAGTTKAFSVFNDFFNLQRMRMVGGAIGFAGEKGKIKDDEKAISEAKRLGEIISKSK